MKNLNLRFYCFRSGCRFALLPTPILYWYKSKMTQFYRWDFGFAFLGWEVGLGMKEAYRVHTA